jgi:hypothetical protein
MSRGFDWNRPAQDRKIRDRGTESVTLDLPEKPPEKTPPRKPRRAPARSLLTWERVEKNGVMRIVPPDEKSRRIKHRKWGADSSPSNNSNLIGATVVATTKEKLSSENLYAGKSHRMDGVTVERRKNRSKPNKKT